MTRGTIHVIGAGLAGLSAAVEAAARGARVVLVEATAQAGGRCRSYFDATLGRVIDNGNHLVLSGNHATHDYLRRIGAADRLSGPDEARFVFADVRSGERWTIAPNAGPLPWWVLAKSRRVPGSSLGEYLALVRLLSPRRGACVGDVIDCKGPVWDKLLSPLLLAALNTEPETACAALAAAVIRETLAKGGNACRPRIAMPSLAAAFIEPALAWLARNGASVQFDKRLRRIEVDGHRTTTLDFAGGPLTLAMADRVILATPASVTHDLLPGVATPDDFRSIVNAHFSISPPAGAAAMTGIIGGTAEWVFAFHDRLSVTVSGADRLIDCDREELAKRLWRDVAFVHGLEPQLPPWQIVKERRATFAATPEQTGKRAGPETAWTNLVLAGDWTDTGLPATIESAVRSGRRAADLALRT